MSALRCSHGPDCIVARENHNGRPDRASHLVMIGRTDVPGNDETHYFCTTCAKAYVGGSIEVANGPQVITVVRLR